MIHVKHLAQHMAHSKPSVNAGNDDGIRYHTIMWPQGIFFREMQISQIVYKTWK